jgi:hypothetical protein
MLVLTSCCCLVLSGSSCWRKCWLGLCRGLCTACPWTALGGGDGHPAAAPKQAAVLTVIITHAEPQLGCLSALQGSLSWSAKQLQTAASAGAKAASHMGRGVQQRRLQHVQLSAQFLQLHAGCFQAWQSLCTVSQWNSRLVAVLGVKECVFPMDLTAGSVVHVCLGITDCCYVNMHA